MFFSNLRKLLERKNKIKVTSDKEVADYDATSKINDVCSQ